MKKAPSKKAIKVPISPLENYKILYKNNISGISIEKKSSFFFNLTSLFNDGYEFTKPKQSLNYITEVMQKDLFLFSYIKKVKKKNKYSFFHKSVLNFKTLSYCLFSSNFFIISNYNFYTKKRVLIKCHALPFFNLIFLKKLLIFTSPKKILLDTYCRYTNKSTWVPHSYLYPIKKKKSSKLIKDGIYIKVYNIYEKVKIQTKVSILKESRPRKIKIKNYFFKVQYKEIYFNFYFLSFLLRSLLRLK